MRRLAEFTRIIAAVLRGLADEDAYARHLARHGVAHSQEQWCHFVDERFRAKYGGGRCC